MYVYMYVCMYVYMYVCMYVCMYITLLYVSDLFLFLMRASATFLISFVPVVW